MGDLSEVFPIRNVPGVKHIIIFALFVSTGKAIPVVCSSHQGFCNISKYLFDSIDFVVISHEIKMVREGERVSLTMWGPRSLQSKFRASV